MGDVDLNNLAGVVLERGPVNRHAAPAHGEAAPRGHVGVVPLTGWRLQPRLQQLPAAAIESSGGGSRPPGRSAQSPPLAAVALTIEPHALGPFGLAPLRQD